MVFRRAAARGAGDSEAQHARSARSELPWAFLDAVVDGRSTLDFPRLDIGSIEDADQFLTCYGYRWARPADREEVQRIWRQGRRFLEEQLLDPGESIPGVVAEQADLRQLLLLASGRSPDSIGAWACALLRVMHAVAHSQSPFNEWFGAEIRRQIIGRFREHIRGTPPEQYLGDIPLASYDVKHQKPFASVVMKLLHKAENVASPVFDRLGVRLVTHSRFDCVLALSYLREQHVVDFANLNPSRSRNTLVDLTQVRAVTGDVAADIREGRISETARLDEVTRRVSELPYPKHGGQNVHSASEYHSVQFTCRQLIHAPAGSLGRNTTSYRFYFPYEVQLMDQASFELTRSGRASHAEYKARQRRTVRRRVLGPLLLGSK